MAENNTEKQRVQELTDKLEQGLQDLFNSDSYRNYLATMSKFHNYSFNNTLLIAMQKPDASLVAGFQSWKNNFKRNVVKGEKGIKILAPSPFKIKQEMEKIDPATQKPVIGADGKPVKEEKEITIPAFKVVSVFDVFSTLTVLFPYRNPTLLSTNLKWGISFDEYSLISSSTTTYSFIEGCSFK